MAAGLAFFEYFIWHYGGALRSGFVFFKNIFLATVYFFSLPLIFQTLFSPWLGMREESRLGFHPILRFGDFIVLTIMRLVGFSLRLSIILLGAVSLVLIAAFLPVVLVLWLLAPFLILLLFIFGLAALFVT